MSLSKSSRLKSSREKSSGAKSSRGQARKAQAGIYLVISLFLAILIVVFFTLWSLKTSEISSKSRQEFILSLAGKRLANILDIVERNQVGFEAEISTNITFADSIIVCDKECIQIKSHPLDEFQIYPLPNGVRIEK